MNEKVGLTHSKLEKCRLSGPVITQNSGYCIPSNRQRVRNALQFNKHLCLVKTMLEQAPVYMCLSSGRLFEWMRYFIKFRNTPWKLPSRKYNNIYECDGVSWSLKYFFCNAPGTIVMSNYYLGINKVPPVGPGPVPEVKPCPHRYPSIKERYQPPCSTLLEKTTTKTRSASQETHVCMLLWWHRSTQL